MALCTKCGTLHHEDDLHLCDVADVVEKGKPIKKGFSKV